MLSASDEAPYSRWRTLPDAANAAGSKPAAYELALKRSDEPLDSSKLLVVYCGATMKESDRAYAYHHNGSHLKALMDEARAKGYDVVIRTRTFGSDAEAVRNSQESFGLCWCYSHPVIAYQ